MPFSATRDLWLILKARDEASRALSNFSRDIRMVGDSVRLANLQAARSALRNQLATQRLSGATEAEMLLTQGHITAIDEEIGRMRVAKSAMEEQRVAAQRLSSVLGGSAAAFTAFGTAAAAAGVFGTLALGNLVKSAVEYEKASSLTRTQVDKFALSLKDVEDIGLRVARNVGVNFQQIQPALFDIFSSMEVGAAGAEMLLTTFAKAAVAGQVDISAASRATIGILNAFQLPISSINHLMDVQFQLVKEGIGSYEEWTQRIGLVTPSAVRAGQSVEMMAAALAASTRMGISAARSGTAVARAMDAFSNPKAIQGLKELGVNALNAEGNFRPMIDVLFDFRKVIQDMPEAKKIETILDVFKGAGGTIEARRFLQNMLITPGNLELFKNIFETMSNESGSFEEAYAIMADTTATKTELMKNSWETLKITAGKILEPAFNRIVALLNQLFTWFNNLTPAQQSLIVKIVSFGVALATVVGILSLIIGTILAFAAAAAVAGTSLFVIIGIVGGLTTALIAFGALLFLAWQRSETFRTSVKNMAQDIIDFWQNSIVPAAEAVRQAFDEKLRPALENLWQVIQDKVLPVLGEISRYIMEKVKPAATELVNDTKEGLINIFEFFSKIIREDVIPAINLLTQYYYDHKKTIDTVIDVIIFLGKWILIIAGFITGVLAIAVGVVLVTAFTTLIATIMAVTWVIEHVVDGFKHAWAAVSDFVSLIANAIDPNVLYRVGNMLVDGLIAGIRNKAWEVKNVITNLGSSAISWFKDAIGAGSPSKEFMKLGEYSVQGYMLGIQKAMPALEAQAVTTTAGLTTAVSGGTSGTGGGGVNQTFNITTQEIDPRRHSAELGWLLAGSS